MTRHQTIAAITARLETLDDRQIETIAEFVQSIVTTDSDELRELTPRELALIDQSKEDFRTGRTLSVEDAKASIDEALASRGVRRSQV